MTEQQKLDETNRIEKKYGKRKGFKNLFNRAQQNLYREDVLQPSQSEFKDVFKKQHLIREATDRAIEKEEIQKQKELDEIYRSKTKSLTLEQKILKDTHSEHPTMISEEDILRW